MRIYIINYSRAEAVLCSPSMHNYYALLIPDASEIVSVKLMNEYLKIDYKDIHGHKRTKTIIIEHIAKGPVLKQLLGIGAVRIDGVDSSA